VLEMADELVEQYNKKKTKLELFFEWLEGLNAVLRILVILAIMFSAGFIGICIRRGIIWLIN